MIDQPPIGARLLFRVDPMPLESPRGYFCRVASAHGYDSPQWLVDLAGFSGPSAALDPENHLRPLARVLRLEPEEWLAMSYRPVKGTGRFAQRAFYGQTVRADQLNYRRPRICPQCLGQRPVWWAVWDLGLVAACPFHRRLLVNQCPACGKKLVWRRPAVERCRCGTDLRTATAEVANADLVAMNAVIYRAAGFSLGAAVELQLAAYHFPPELGRLALGPLLRLIRFVGFIGEKDRLRRKQRSFPRTDLTTAVQAGQATTSALRDWPRPLREVLRRMLPSRADNPAALKFSEIFGNFYRHLFRVLPRNEFGFLHDAFEEFVTEDWKGLIRGQHRYFTAATRRNSHWMTASEARRMARTSDERILDLVRLEEIEGIFVRTPPDGSRTECWIRRQSLKQWIANRDAELTRYMSRPEAKRVLGLTNCTIVKVAAAGIIRNVQGPERNLPIGVFFFLGEDVMKIKHGFEKHAVPLMAYSEPGELIALRHAMKNYLGRDSGLAAVIKAVVDGTLTPVGYTKRFRGITGYLFLADDLRKYRPVPDVKAPPEGFLNYREAASVLGVKAPVIRGMVAQGLLSAPAGYRPGVSKLVPAAEVQRFAKRYVAATVLAKRLNLSSWSFTRYLKESGKPALAVPIPKESRRPASFLLKTFVAHYSSEALRRCKTRRSNAN